MRGILTGVLLMGVLSISATMAEAINISISPSSPIVGASVTFTATGCVDCSDYWWEFERIGEPAYSDGGSGYTLRKTFPLPGTYWARVTGDTGESRNKKFTVTANNFTVNIVPSAGCTVTAGDGGVDAPEADGNGIACAGGMAATNPLCTELFKNADLATLKVAPESGFVFTGWTVNGAEIKTASANMLFLSAMPVLAGKAVQIPNGGTCQANCSKVTITAPTTVKRDEIFDVTLTLVPPPLLGTQVKFDLIGQKTQTLPERGEVQMYDFGYDRDFDGDIDPGQTSYTFVPVLDGGGKTIKAVYNLFAMPPQTQTAIKIAAILGNYVFESEPIAVVYQMRKYVTTFENEPVNNYDVLIKQGVDYWTHWHYPNEQSPFMFKTTDLDSELVKAICYKESSMKKNDLMSVTAEGGKAINVMRGPKKNPRDFNWAAPPDADGRYNMENYKIGTLPRIDDGAVFMNYSAFNVNDDSHSARIKWGIRWLYSKRSHFDIYTSSVPWKAHNPVWYSWEKTLDRYGDQSSSYTSSVMNLYLFGKNPHPKGKPTFLWPIRTDNLPSN